MKYESSYYSGVDPAKPGSEKTVANVFCDGKIVASFEGSDAMTKANEFINGANDALARTAALTE